MTYLDVMKGWLCMTCRYVCVSVCEKGGGEDQRWIFMIYNISLNDEYSWDIDITAWQGPNYK